MKQVMVTALVPSHPQCPSGACGNDSFVSAGWAPSSGLSPSGHPSRLAHYIPARMEGPLQRTIILSLHPIFKLE